MTSEVLIMNRHAVALAADSAMTISSFDSVEKKYVKGVNKLFELSDNHPVGVMIFGSAELMRVPWEVIVKDFRNNLGMQCQKSVLDYALQFCQYLEGHVALFPMTLQEGEVIAQSERWAARIVLEIEGQDHIKAINDTEEKNQVRLETLNQYENDFENQGLHASIRPEDLAGYLAKFLPEVTPGVEKAMKQLGFPFPAEQLASVAIKAYVKSFGASNSTGVVFAGYGSDDYFPSYVECRIYGFLPRKTYIHTPTASSHHTPCPVLGCDVRDGRHGKHVHKRYQYGDVWNAAGRLADQLRTLGRKVEECPPRFGSFDSRFDR